MSEELKSKFEDIVNGYDFMEALRNETDVTGMSAYLDLMQAAYDMAKAENDVTHNRLLNRISELEAQVACKDDEWVGVGDRLPEMDTPVLIYTDLNYMGEGSLLRQHTWLLIGIGVANNITHWQPLPTPPNQ